MYAHNAYSRMLRHGEKLGMSSSSNQKEGDPTAMGYKITIAYTFERVGHTLAIAHSYIRSRQGTLN